MYGTVARVRSVVLRVASFVRKSRGTGAVKKDAGRPPLRGWMNARMRALTELMLTEQDQMFIL
jgi:hypothetical protein